MSCECDNFESNNINSCFEKNVIILRYKKIFIFFLIFSISFIYLYTICYVIIPYISTRDIGQILPAHNLHESKKIILLIYSFFYLICFPAIIPAFYSGDIYIYCDKVELHPFLKIFRKRVIYYNDDINIITKSLGMKISKNENISLLRNPYKYWKNMYFYSISVPLYQSVLSNPSNLQFAVKFLKKYIENKNY